MLCLLALIKNLTTEWAKPGTLHFFLFDLSVRSTVPKMCEFITGADEFAIGLNKMCAELHDANLNFAAWFVVGNHSLFKIRLHSKFSIQQLLLLSSP